MKIISWNVNGLRSLAKQGYWDWLPHQNADIFCLQEVKAEESQVPEDVRALDGYCSYFNSSKTRKGYSGVATFTKQKPLSVQCDVLPEEYNQEGRVIETVFEKFVLLNIYFPNGGGAPERLQYKLDFYDAFLEYIETLRKAGQSIIFCGDVNVAHTEIDLARPKENQTHVGFLPEEREWMDQVVDLGYIDTFRHFYPNKTGAYTYWDQYSHARDRNVGWRIDYFFLSPDLEHRLKKSEIHSEVYGSDHCPIILEIDI